MVNFLFNQYSITKINSYYIVQKDYVAENKTFNVLKNAVS
jgi:hypothetical protein